MCVSECVKKKVNESVSIESGVIMRQMLSIKHL